jgi:hypothetical protein
MLHFWLLFNFYQKPFSFDKSKAKTDSGPLARQLAGQNILKKMQFHQLTNPVPPDYNSTCFTGGIRISYELIGSCQLRFSA